MRRVEPHLAVFLALVPHLVAAWTLFTGLNLIRGPFQRNLSAGLAEDETQEATGVSADVAPGIEVPTSAESSSETGSCRNKTMLQVDSCCGAVQHCTTAPTRDALFITSSFSLHGGWNSVGVLLAWH